MTSSRPSAICCSDFAESRDRVAVGQNLESLFEAFELLDAHDDNGRNTVAGHDHAIVLFVDPVETGDQEEPPHERGGFCLLRAGVCRRGESE